MTFSMEPDAIKLGIIGYGYTGQQHARAVKALQGVDLVAVAETDPEKRTLATVKNFNDYRYLLEDPSIHAVSICLPHAWHEEVATEALNAGKHVLVEKPLAISVVAGERLCRLAKSVSRILMVEMTHRFMPTLVEVRKLLQDGCVGEVMAVTDTILESFGLFGSLPAWMFSKRQAGGGVGLTSGIHLLDHVAWVTGQALTLDSAWFSNSRALGDVEDTAAYSLHLSKGAPVHILLCWRAQGKSLEGELSIYGSKGSVHVGVWHGWRLETEAGCQEKACFEDRLTIPERVLEGMKGALTEFATAICENRDPTLKPEQTLVSQRLIEQAYQEHLM